MALLRYFKLLQTTQSFPDCKSYPSLSDKELKSANQNVAKCLAISMNRTDTRQSYNGYSAEEHAQIGKYAAENGPTRASKHFSKILKKKVPESSVRQFREEYFKKTKELSSKITDGSPVVVKALPQRIEEGHCC